MVAVRGITNDYQKERDWPKVLLSNVKNDKLPGRIVNGARCKPYLMLCARIMKHSCNYFYPYGIHYVLKCA